MEPPPQQTGDLPVVGTVIAERYRVCGLLGEGGMAVVYLAEGVVDRREVAVKVLRPEIADDPEVVRRFLQEARAASLIRHRNIVDIIDFGFAAGGVAFLAMERLQGSDLATLLSREGPLPWARLGPLAIQITAALGAAHRHGIIHRDVKPENCFLTVDAHGAPVVKVLDFGIAKDLGGRLPDRPQTVTGMLCGSPEYMSPESIMAPVVDPRSDLYSLGITLYELLTGHHPFEGASVGEMLAAHVQRPPPPMRQWRVKVAEDVEALVRRCLAKDPKDRYPDALALGRAIEASLGVALDA
ncbi:MAG: serine/threonine-protein kinase, partial [Nannocystaceae bacterium]